MATSEAPMFSLTHVNRDSNYKSTQEFKREKIFSLILTFFLSTHTRIGYTVKPSKVDPL